MQVSIKGLGLIKNFEGCRLVAYQDSVGVRTIGYGHTKGVKQGDKITLDQADEYLKQDVIGAAGDVSLLGKVRLISISFPLFSPAYWDVITEIHGVNNTRFGAGKCIIRMQNKDSADKTLVSWHGEDACPVNTVKYHACYASDISFSVRLRNYVGLINV